MIWHMLEQCFSDQDLVNIRKHICEGQKLKHTSTKSPGFKVFLKEETINLIEHKISSQTSERNLNS